MEILFELVAGAHPHEIEQRSERVYRIVKFQDQQDLLVRNKLATARPQDLADVDKLGGKNKS